jgi:hypothetical protein
MPRHLTIGQVLPPPVLCPNSAPSPRSLGGRMSPGAARCGGCGCRWRDWAAGSGRPACARRWSAPAHGRSTSHPVARRGLVRAAAGGRPLGPAGCRHRPLGESTLRQMAGCGGHHRPLGLMREWQQVPRWYCQGQQAIMPATDAGSCRAPLVRRSGPASLSAAAPRVRRGACGRPGPPLAPHRVLAHKPYTARWADGTGSEPLMRVRAVVSRDRAGGEARSEGEHGCADVWRHW